MKHVHPHTGRHRDAMPRQNPGFAPLARITALALAAIFGACSSGEGTNDSDSNAVAADGAGQVDAANSDVAADTATTGDGTGDAASDSGSDTGDAAANDAAADDGTTPDTAVSDPCAPGAASKTLTVAAPLGETFFFDGDDYLAFWGGDNACAVTVLSKPAGAKAEIVGVSTGSAGRLTPDSVGVWTLQRGADTVNLAVAADYWNSDTFQNYNYAPTQPLLREPPEKDDTGKVKDDDGSKATLWLAATTSAQVQRIDVFAIDAPAGVKAVVGATVATGSWPTALALWPGTKWLLVTTTGRDTLGFIDRDAGVLVDAVRLGNEPHNVIVDGEGDDAKAWVVLAGEDRVVRVDLKTRTIDASVDVGHEPRALALDAKARRLYVGSLVSGNAHPKGPLQKDEKVPAAWQRDVVVIDIDSAKAVAVLPEVGTINRGLAFERDGNGDVKALLVATTRANNVVLQVNADTRPHAHHLVRVDLAKLLAGGGSSAVAKDVDLDKQPTSKGPAASPYAMARTPAGHYLAVTLSAGKAMLFLHPETLAEIGRVETGHDPRSLVFAVGRAWTYSWLSDQLDGVDLPGAPTEVEWKLAGGLGGGEKPMKWAFPYQPAANVVVAVGADPTPADVRAGQRIFNDAAFSKLGDFSCNNCHIDGLTDGLVWDLLIDGPVNTIAFRNVGGTEPFLWGGQLPTLFDFSREVLKLVGADASGAQMDMLTRYMQSVTAPPNPHALPGGKLTAQAEAGKSLFNLPATKGGGCGSCHSGPLGTSGQLVQGKTKGKDTDVPSLLGVYDTAPYGREGQWFTLVDMVDFALEFTGAQLNGAAFDATSRDAIVAYVRQLPGDLLTLGSARPLAGADHVWKEVEPELMFSAVLATGQEGHFHFVRIAADGSETPVVGVWALSGRAARFKVTAGALELDSSYRIDVDAGLKSTFGQTLYDDLAVAFTTGGIPAFDVSGKWKMTLASPAIGKITVNVAVLMATGGKMTGVVLDNFDEGSIGADAITGVVSGTTLQLDPFYVDSQFGKFFVKDGFASTLEDTNADGFADKGKGDFEFKFGPTVYPIAVTWLRTALPNG
jgi:hypothetical protein